MKHKKMLAILLSMFTLVLVPILVGRINSSLQFKKQVQTVFNESGNSSIQSYHKSQLDGLPEPVQRYFKHVLKPGQSYISYARLTHDGQIKLGQNKKWTDIKGEQYFSVKKPGYIWKGTTPLVTARDMYIAGRGRLIVTLLSLVNVVDGKGEEFNESEFQRWLAESVWFPTNLLPSVRLKWLSIDAQTAKLLFKYNELSVEFLVTFNAMGEITEMETNRFMEKGKKERWVGKLSDYRSMNGILVPTKIEAIWRLEKGDHSYVRFNVKKLDYNIPLQFE